MKRRCSTCGLTLIELILAVILLSVVVMTGMSMEMAVRRTLNTVDYETELMGEATAILALATEAVNRGIGFVGLSAYNNNSAGNDFNFSIREDTNLDGRYDAASDATTTFRFSSGGPWQWQLAYFQNATLATPTTILSTRCITFYITPPFNGASNITVTLQRNPGNNPDITVNNLTNIRLSLSTTAYYLSNSLN